MDATNSLVGLWVIAKGCDGVPQFTAKVEYVNGSYLGLRHATGRLDEWPASWVLVVPAVGTQSILPV